MKKIILALILCLSLVCNTGCAFILLDLLLDSSVSESTTDVKTYGDFHDDVQVPSYYPKNLSGYTVNYYFYAVEKDYNIVYEIFLDVTVSESAFTGIISGVMADSREKTVKSAYHSPEYNDIIFNNEYRNI